MKNHSLRYDPSTVIKTGGINKMLDLQQKRPDLMVADVVRPKDEGELCKLLKERIQVYKKAHPRLSSIQIAKRFGISSSSFGRIENLDILSPSLDLVVKILRGTGNLEELIDFLEKFFPDVSASYSSFYKKYKHATLESPFSKYVQQRRYFKILIVIATTSLSQNEVTKYFGKEGKTIIKELLEARVVYFDGVSYKVNEKRFSIDDDTTIQVHMNTLQEFAVNYDSNDLLRCYSVDYVKVNSEKVVLEVMDVIRKARNEIMDILLDTNNSGEDVFFVGLSADTVFKKKGIKNENK